MKLNERAEEILEMLWVSMQEREQAPMKIGAAQGSSELDELEKAGYIKIVNGEIALTVKGKEKGENIVRRHRLAERLFADIIEVKKDLVHPMSCQFEHLLYDGVEDNICILLGHPKTCPHGKLIPQGECCKKSRESAGKVVCSLINLEAKQKGRIAYLRTKDNKKIQKLMAMGVLPGMSIMLIQKYPSYVLQLGQSQFALDKDLAEDIYVRKVK